MSGTREDPAPSVHQRLLNGARDRGEDFQLTLVRYGAERLLYRLGKSPHAQDFVLKGALLLLLWSDEFHRPTRDVDLAGHGEATVEHLREVFRSVCLQSCPEDALRFDEDSVIAEEIRAAQEYGGVRVVLSAYLGKARIRLQVDIGFGDAITPEPQNQDFPTLLQMPAPRLSTYPIETVIAEKFEAMVRFGRANSRMKDFRDLTMFARRSKFDGALLCRAVTATFQRREADLDDIGEVLAPDFYADPVLARRWRTYCQATGESEAAGTFAEIGGELVRFLEPLAEALLGGRVLGTWGPDHGWTDEGSEGRDPAAANPD